MRARVQFHGPRSRFCLQGLHHGELIWRFFLRDGGYSLAARGKGEASGFIEGAAVSAGTDRHCREDLTVFGVKHHHHLVVAGSK